MYKLYQKDYGDSNSLSLLLVKKQTYETEENQFITTIGYNLSQVYLIVGLILGQPNLL